MAIQNVLGRLRRFGLWSIIWRGQGYSIDLEAALLRVAPWQWIGALALALRLINVGQESIWYDESFTSWLAHLPLNNMMLAIRGDVHPPLWYLIEWLNIRLLGSSEIALRLPNVILGTLAVLLLIRVCRALGLSGQIQIAAGLMAAIMPANLYYSQDARMYPLLCVFVLLMLIGALENRWGLFTLAAIGALYTQNLGAFYIAAIGGAAFIMDKGRRRAIYVAALIIFEAWMPWLFYGFIPQAGQVGAGFWLEPLTPAHAVLPLFTMTVGWRLADVFQIHLYALVVIFSLIGLYTARKWLISRSGLILLSGMLGAALLMIVVSALWRSIYLQRALLPAAMLIPILWAYELENFSGPTRRHALWALIPLFVLSTASHYFPAQGGRPDVRPWAQVIKDGWQPGDVIYYIAIDSSITLNYYMPGYAYALYPFGSDLSQSLTGATKRAMGLQELAFADLAKAGFKRAWVVSANSPMISHQQLAETHRIEDLPHSVVKSFATDLLYESVMLVDLKEMIQ